MQRADDGAGSSGGIPPLESRPNEREANLTQRAVRGAIWSIATGVGSRAIGLVGTLLLTRFLDPDTYGDASVATLVVLTAQMMSNCGLPQYLVAKPNEGRAAAFHATFFFVLLGVLALGLAVILRGPLSTLLEAPDLVSYIPGLAFAGLCERFVIIQDAIQVRHMRFRSLSLQRSMGELVYAVVTLTLAWRGYGGYAMVWGTIARSSSRLISLSATTPRNEWLEPCKLTLTRAREVFKFGLPMSVGAIASFGARKWDNFLIAGYFGTGAAGIYNLAYNFADIPATQIGETIGDVLVPSFAKMESDERRKKALVLSLRIMMLIVAPLAVGLGAVAPELVRTFFNEKWGRRSISLMIMILSGLSVVRPIGWVASSYLQVKDRPRIIMVLEIGKTTSLLVLMAIFAHLGKASDHGVYYACVAVGLAFGVSALSYLWAIRMVDGTPLSQLLLPLLPPLLACVPMALAVFGVQRFILYLGGAPSALVLAAQVVLGAVVFVVSAFVIANDATREFITLLRAARARRLPQPVDAPATKAA